MLHLTDRFAPEPSATEASLPLSLHPVPTSVRTHLAAIAIAVSLVAVGLLSSPTVDEISTRPSTSGQTAAVAQP